VNHREPALAGRQVARRAADPQVVSRAIAAAGRARVSDLPPWRPASLAQGHAGLAVLCAELDAAEQGAGWDRAGHHHLTAAVAMVSPHDASLFSGLAGLGFAATILAAGRSRYERLLTQVDEALAPLVDRGLRRLAAASGCRVGEFDLVSGLTGTGVYLLTRHQVRVTESGQAMLGRVLRGLIELTADPCHPRRWHTPAALAAGPLRDGFPGGLHNCGLAHGVPGPLALLSLAVLSGVRAPGAAEAIHSSASWLAEHATGTAREPDWPDGVPLDADRRPPATPDGTSTGPGRAAWCYGAPGVARSLWLAGCAVAEPRWQELAIRAIRAVAARPEQAWGLATPAFCHGRAGLLQVLRRFAADLADPEIESAARRLAASLAAEFDPAALLGVRSAEPDGTPADQPGLLDGAAGVALALLGRPQARYAPRPAWDRMFLLA